MRTKKLWYSLVPVLLLLFLFPSHLRAETVVDSDIKHDAVWTPAGSPYVITNDIVLEEGISLKIEPGTLVRIYPEKTIEVKGDFRAVGTTEQPIVFTAYGEGAWGNIYFTDFSNDATYTDAGQYTAGCILSHCIIEKSDGLFIRFGAPFVTQCEIRNNISSGIRVEFGGPRIIGNRIYANSTVQDPASGNGAGIIAYTDKNVIISDNVIYNNISEGGRDGGGGIYAYAADDAVITITNNTIFGNTSSRFAGGIYAYKGILKGNSVFDNTALLRGGGIYAVECSVVDNLVQRNTADRGAGIFAENGEIKNNSIVQNAASGAEGGGIHYFGSGTVENNSIIGNTAAGEDGCGGIYVSGNPVIRSNNIFGNSGYALAIANVVDAPDVIASENYWGSPSEQTVLRLVYDWNDNELAGLAIYKPILTNLSETAPAPPPMNVRAAAKNDGIELAWDEPAGTTFGTHRIYVGSASGYPYDRVLQSGPGKSFLVRGLEPGKRYFFSVDGCELQNQPEAVSALSNEISVLNVATKPPEAPHALAPRDKAEGLSKDVVLKASSQAGAASYRWQVFMEGEDNPIPAIEATTSGKHLNECKVESGNLEGGRKYSWRVAACSPTGTWSEWSKAAYFSMAPDSTSVISGPISTALTFEKKRSPYLIAGNTIIMPEGTLLIEPGVQVRVAPGKDLKVRGTLIARGTQSEPIGFTRDSSEKWGSIIFADQSSDAQLQNGQAYSGGTILESCAIEGGKGIVVEAASPLIKDCVIANNDGSGIVVRQGGPVIIGNDIHHNVAPTNGGGIYAYTNDIILVERNKIHENSADGDGGGIYAYGYMNTSTIHVENNDIFRNKATGNGGGIFLSRSSAVANRIESNTAKSSGGGIYSTFGLIDKNKISENQADEGGGIFTEHNSSITRNYVSANRALSEFGGGVYINFWGTSIENETFSKNTVTGNRCEGEGDNGGVYVLGYLVFQENNLYGNTGSQLYNANEKDSSPLVAANCYWGTSDKNSVAGTIIDADDNPKLGKVTFEPFSVEPLHFD